MKELRAENNRLKQDLAVAKEERNNLRASQAEAEERAVAAEEASSTAVADSRRLRVQVKMLEDEREGLVARARAGTPAEGAEAYESEIEALRGLVLEQVANTERFVQANLVLAKAAAEHEAQLAALRAAEDDLQRRANALQLTNARLTRDSATAQDTITRLTAELEQAKR